MRFRKKLLILYAASVMFLLSLFAVVLCVSTYNSIRSSQQAQAYEIARYKQAAVNELYATMKNAATSFASNRENLGVLSRFRNGETIDFYAARAELASSIRPIYMIIQDIYDVLLFMPDQQSVISYLRDSRYLISEQSSLMNQPITEEILYDRLSLHPNDWSRNREPVISYIMPVRNGYGSILAYIELQIAQPVLDAILCAEDDSHEVFVFDQTGRMLYPQLCANVQESQPFAEQCKNAPVQARAIVEKNGWEIYVTGTKSLLMQQMYRVVFVIVAALLVLFLLLVMIQRQVIRRLLTPLQTLSDQVSQVTLANMRISDRADQIDEVRMLQNSFDAMLANIQSSVNQVYESQLRELKAQYQSMQAQINSHFLYNTLCIINVWCEEGESALAGQACMRLAEMMKYTAHSFDMVGTIRSELNHMEHYLEIFSWHYEGAFSYTVQVDEALYEVEVPRCILQPIVENSFLHGFDKVLPPWQIGVTGKKTGFKSWYIRICDNGAGFKAEEIEAMRAAFAEYERNIAQRNLKSNLTVGGMGLLNIYARLRMHYPEGFFFTIEDNEPRGSRITFGVDLKE